MCMANEYPGHENTVNRVNLFNMDEHVKVLIVNIKCIVRCNRDLP